MSQATESYQPGSELIEADELGEELYSLKSIGRAYSRQQDEEQQLHDSPSNNSNDSTEKRSPESSQNGSTDPPQPPSKVGLLHPNLKDLWVKLGFIYLKNYLLFGVLIITAFSIYWGALYDRQGHLHRLKMLIVVEDDAISTNNFGGALVDIIQSEKFQKLGNWQIIQGQDNINDYFHNPENLTAAITEKVHRRRAWGGARIFANATYNTLRAFQEGGELQPSVEYIYETGREINSVNTYVVGTFRQLQQEFNSIYPSIAQSLISNLTSSQQSNLLQSNVLTTLPIFRYVDNRPYDDNTLLAPLQVGLIYLIIMSFFQFNSFVEAHKLLLPHVKVPQYLLYRIVGNHFSYLIISLFISAVSAIFQVDFTRAFGKGGFVVYWLTTYLTMAAVGGANENMALIIFTYNFTYLGFWLISFVILNVSPSFSPMDLTSVFYRYGYMMPIYHSSEISRVIFLDMWKGHLGMHYGVIVAWIVLNTLLLPFILKHVGGVMAKRAKEAAQAGQAGNQ